LNMNFEIFLIVEFINLLKSDLYRYLTSMTFKKCSWEINIL